MGYRGFLGLTPEGFTRKVGEEVARMEITSFP
jgi:hypothetical protein